MAAGPPEWPRPLSASPLRSRERSPPADPPPPSGAGPEAERLIPAAVAVTLGAQALVVLASLVLPLIGTVVLPAMALPPHVVGWYASGVFVVGALSTLLTPLLVARHGAVRVHQAMLALGAVGLTALAAEAAPALALSALLIGLAYGPANPASSALLARLAPPRLRNRVFSLKQIAVPLGGAAAGLIVPLFAAVMGWRPAVLCVAALLAVAALLVEPWRRRLDQAGGGIGGAQGVLAPFRAIGSGGPALRLGGAALCFATVQFSFAAFMPTVLIGTVGWSLAAAGATLTVALAVSIVARIALGWLADRIPAAHLLIALGLAMTAACVAAAMIGPRTPAGVVFAIAGLFGFAAYGWNGLMLAEAARLAQPGSVAAATAGMMMLVYGGATIGPALFGTAFAASGRPSAGFFLLAAFALAPLAWLRNAPQPRP
jgi:predicted MFS family arabinose efflux permease